MVKPKNTIILPGYEEVVRDDVRRIAAGEARWNSEISFYEINGRTYNVKPNGTVFPGTGDGFVLLDRNEYLALQKIVQAGGDLEKIVDFRRNPRFTENPDIVAKAKSIYDGTYQQ